MAGLSLVHHLLQSPLRDKRILIIDQEWKSTNDRTWCFWEKEAGIFEDIVHHSWQKLDFFSPQYSEQLDIAPYTYKMIRGIDFYEKIQAEITKNENVFFVEGKVQSIDSQGDSVCVLTNNEQYYAQYCFNSIPSQSVDKSKYLYLAQHFKGWIIRTEKPSFDPASATLMDFRLPHEGETKFVYVLPTSEHEALVEMTFFSPEILEEQVYDDLLRSYIQNYLSEVKEYEIIHEEFGVIPMTDFHFSRGEGRIVNIGTAGGHTKASTGYTFWNVQQYLARIVAQMSAGQPPHLSTSFLQKRFALYDAIFLDVLQKKRLAPPKLFGTLFQKNKPADVLAFLSEELSVLEDFKIMLTLPKLPFLRGLWSIIR